MDLEPVRRKRGRRLSFDRDAALHQAMLLFWRHGYEGTSLNALTEALGVTPPSIYTAFGDKKRLFREAVGLYLSGGPGARQIIDQAVTARAAAHELLSAAAAGYTGPDRPSGCLLATSAISCSPESAEIQSELGEIRRGIEQHLRQRIAGDIASGALPPGTDATALAGLVVAVIQGMSTLARDGASTAHVRMIADAAMAAWPPDPA
ncbi:TetR/AcrR family transcriptional regulator [Lichenicola sp.]|uniref:TetR/AcrR family transcriptional regulator n=1 Tax=Lichenicola sp. TaxID=2804529 RepID=UPI003B0029C3